jgi:predicted metalloprotease
VQVTSDYWNRHWSQNFTGPYSAPKVTGLYDSRRAPIPCQSWGGVSTSNNAWYCSTTDAVGFDVPFMQRVFQLGNTFLYLVVAHEWGHAIQQRLDSRLVSQAKELQADCFAGAVLYGAAADGKLKWENGDTQELARDLTNVADKYPWTKVGDHGSPTQRINSFGTGKGGPKACFGPLG